MYSFFCFFIFSLDVINFVTHKLRCILVPNRSYSVNIITFQGKHLFIHFYISFFIDYNKIIIIFIISFIISIKYLFRYRYRSIIWFLIAIIFSVSLRRKSPVHYITTCYNYVQANTRVASFALLCTVGDLYIFFCRRHAVSWSAAYYFSLSIVYCFGSHHMSYAHMNAKIIITIMNNNNFNEYVWYDVFRVYNSNMLNPSAWNR